MALNHITVMGRLTADPELRRTTNGTEVCSATVAVDRDVKDANGVRQTDFFDFVAWRGSATFLCNFFRKGDMIAISGRLQTRTWKDKDGNNRHGVEIVSENLYFCGKKNGDTSNTYEDRPVAEPVLVEADEEFGEPPF